MSSQAKQTLPTGSGISGIGGAMQPNNAAADVKPVGQAAEKVKPCCVCKEEKQARDECMLFSTASDPQSACGDLVGRYRSCMKGFGFEMP